MVNIIGAFIFILISFITWLAVSFKIVSYFIDERYIFSKRARIMFFYFVNGLLALIMTVICYIVVCMIQEVV